MDALRHGGGFEGCFFLIEAGLTRRPGDAAGVRHTARSRHDIDHRLVRMALRTRVGGRADAALAQAAALRDPSVFRFDEPPSNLDAQLRSRMRPEIRKLHQRVGSTIIFVTHDQVEAMATAGRIASVLRGIGIFLPNAAEARHRERDRRRPALRPADGGRAGPPGATAIAAAMRSAPPATR